MIVWTVVYEC